MLNEETLFMSRQKSAIKGENDWALNVNSKIEFQKNRINSRIIFLPTYYIYFLRGRWRFYVT